MTIKMKAKDDFRVFFVLFFYFKFYFVETYLKTIKYL